MSILPKSFFKIKYKSISYTINLKSKRIIYYKLSKGIVNKKIDKINN